MRSSENELFRERRKPYFYLDLLYAIERKELPSWTVKVQVMPFADAPKYRFKTFDGPVQWGRANRRD